MSVSTAGRAPMCLRRENSDQAPLPEIRDATMVIILVALHQTTPLREDRGTSMGPINASEFKAKCLKLMDEVVRAGEEPTITRHGVPVAKLVPERTPGPGLIGLHAGQIDFRADILSPVAEHREAGA
ncbi:MAG: type II toxin-antitoxin system prevent-host-death family antitoxin [Pseudomonadales bacterium]|nr:type II toxin-antitoxin system prevent-host-death family antitoxin [Pseudomonadales bacterium]